jgi:hypothetical protein
VVAYRQHDLLGGVIEIHTGAMTLSPFSRVDGPHLCCNQPSIQVLLKAPVERKVEHGLQPGLQAKHVKASTQKKPRFSQSTTKVFGTLAI